MLYSEDFSAQDFSFLLQIAEEINGQLPIGCSATEAVLRLRKQGGNYPPELLPLAIDIVLARRECTLPEPWKSKAWFLRRSLQQASMPRIAQHHAEKFSGSSNVLELCAGAGFDTIAIANVVQRLTSVENNPYIASIHSHNIKVFNLQNKVTILCAKAEEVVNKIDTQQCDGLWADPARRTDNGQRLLHPEQWLPPLSWLMSLPIKGVCGIKISPAADISCPPEWRREWIGTANECIEQVLWKNTPVIDGSVQIIMPEQTYSWHPSLPNSVQPKEIAVEQITDMYLIEPHPALIRSGYLHLWMLEHNLQRLDPHIAYCIAEQLENLPKQNVWSAFRILEVMPFDSKKLKKRVKELGWNAQTAIKKRGWSGEVEQLHRQLGFCSTKESNNYGVIILTRIGNRHYSLLTQKAE